MTRSEKLARKNVVCEQCMKELRIEVRRYVTEENIEEFLKDLNRAYKKGSLGLCWSEVKKNIEKWEKIREEVKEIED